MAPCEGVLDYADRQGIVIIDETATVGLNIGLAAGSSDPLTQKACSSPSQRHLRHKQPKLTAHRAPHLVELSDLGTYSTAELAELFGGPLNVSDPIPTTRPRLRQTLTGDHTRAGP